MVQLLQQMNILPLSGTCINCDLCINEEYKKNRNYLYWSYQVCRNKTAIRSNSNMKLEQFVLLMYCFAVENESSLPSGPGYKECLMSSATIAKWNKYFTFICCKYYDINHTNYVVPDDVTVNTNKLKDFGDR